jgi:hypothetical protein
LLEGGSLLLAVQLPSQVALQVLQV